MKFRQMSSRASTSFARTSSPGGARISRSSSTVRTGCWNSILRREASGCSGSSEDPPRTRPRRRVGADAPTTPGSRMDVDRNATGPLDRLVRSAVLMGLAEDQATRLATRAVRRLPRSRRSAADQEADTEAHRQLLRRWRRERRRAPGSPEGPADLPAPAGYAPQEAVPLAVRRALAELADLDRALLVARFRAGLDAGATAAALGLEAPDVDARTTAAARALLVFPDVAALTPTWEPVQRDEQLRVLLDEAANGLRLRLDHAAVAGTEGPGRPGLVAAVALLVLVVAPALGLWMARGGEVPEDWAPLSDGDDMDTVVTVPGVEAATRQEARESLAAVGLRAVFEFEPSCRHVSRVISQSPEAGTRRPVGSDVTAIVGTPTVTGACPQDEVVDGAPEPVGAPRDHSWTYTWHDDAGGSRSGPHRDDVSDDGTLREE
jgi:DNA-directed RNA polymerase specialized sigma24 family protein